ncbi:restriction endonuclease subunit S [Elizabethkingia anophelis]|nr:restriction endonuclease subunit S [Elizabethkingia anophelis]
MTFFPNSGNIPKLRFSEFTEEWGTKTLGKIGEVVNGLTYSPNDIDEHGVLVLRSSNVQNRTITFTDNVFVKANNFNPVKENDILICVRNGSKNLIGKNALVKKQNEGLAFGAFMAIYRSEFNRFLFQWFDTKDYKDIVNKNLGATINSINGGDLKKFKVPFPSLKEQEKIASFLSLIDERILSQKKIIEKLETLMKSSLESLFSRKIKFKTDNTIWKSKKLKDILKITTGKLDANAMVKGGIYRFYTCAKEHYYINTYAFDTEALLVSGNGANVGYIHYYKGRFNAYQRTYVLYDVSENVHYVKFFLDNFLYKRIFSEKKEGNTPYIVLSTLSEMSIQVPDLNIQIQIANFLSFIQEKIDTEKQILEKLERQKKFLLANLFV